jgi:hypothetical protein
MSGESLRGSDYLTAKYTEQDFDQLLAAGESAGAKLTDVFPFGVSAFDGVSVHWQVTPEQVTGLVAGLTAMEIRQQIQVMTKGVAKIDLVEVSVQAGSARFAKP